MNPTSSPATASPPSAPPHGERGAIAALARTASIEMTWRDCGELAACARLLAPGTLMYVSHIPGQAWAQTVSTSVAVRAAGLEPVPHVPVRELTDEVTLRSLLEQLVAQARVTRLLLIAGDRAEPRGPFAETLDVLGSGLFAQAGIRQVTVAGHPEGHPRIAAAELRRAERAKLAWAATAAAELTFLSQFSFDAAPFLGWMRALRAQGVRARIVAGLAGPANLSTLFRYALRCGVGPSLRALGARPASLAGLVGERGPEGVVRAIARIAGDATVEPVGIHLYSFGGLTRSCAWIEAVARGRFALDDSGGFNVDARY